MVDPTAEIPDNLKPYIAEQDYSKYTARDQASWRYIMRQNRKFFQKHAHPVYLEGLEKTGIPISRIPHISEMNKKLADFGWGAVCVRGFIPPAAFLEFQARNLLPIATDMRTMEHIAYTPAPDIVHEAAGHAPIIADPDYSNYLTRYAQLARKAIYSDEDIKMFEAIRELSDIKENPDATKDQIVKSEARLAKAVDSITFVSESSKVTRMYWWTAEYGLIENKEGELLIYGAGLLSSVGEGQKFLTKEVKKIPISIDCINQEFNITEPQPQLFVTKSFHQLCEVLIDLEKTMSFKIGGNQSLEKGIESKSLTTTALDSGLSISGVIEEMVPDAKKPETNASFIRWSGPVQLAFDDSELENQGRKQHPEGFSTPLGNWKNTSKTPQSHTDEDLKALGISTGEIATLEFDSGFIVKGKIKSTTRKAGKLIIITWADCTAKFGEKTCFLPEWGDFDMAVGVDIPSVFGGPADFQNYGATNLGEVNTQPGRTSPHTASELELYKLYDKIRDIRDAKHSSNIESDGSALKVISDKIKSGYPTEWLAAVEILEVANQKLEKTSTNTEWLKSLESEVLNPSQYNETDKTLIANGLEQVAVLD